MNSYRYILKEIKEEPRWPGFDNSDDAEEVINLSEEDAFKGFADNLMGPQMDLAEEIKQEEDNQSSQYRSWHPDDFAIFTSPELNNLNLVEIKSEPALVSLSTFEENDDVQIIEMDIEDWQEIDFDVHGNITEIRPIKHFSPRI